jgi:hypothetical protein
MHTCVTHSVLLILCAVCSHLYPIQCELKAIWNDLITLNLEQSRLWCESSLNTMRNTLLNDMKQVESYEAFEKYVEQKIVQFLTSNKFGAFKNQCHSSLAHVSHQIHVHAHFSSSCPINHVF